MATTFNTTIHPNTIPEALRRLPQWLLWSGEKHPCTVVQPGVPASWTNPATWSSFEAVTAAKNGGNWGVGFVLPAEASELGTLDLDGCRNPQTGEIAEWALLEVERLDTYTEITPSGTGLRAWFFVSPGLLDASSKKLKFAGEKNHLGLELYVRNKFLTVTGDRWPASCAEIERRDREVEDLYQRMQDGRVGPPEYRRQFVLMNQVESDYEDSKRRQHIYVDPGGRLDARDFCQRHGIPILRQRTGQQGLAIYVIACPGSHGGYRKDDGRAWISQAPDGKLAAGCHHATCDLHSDHGNPPRWRQLREMFEPRRKQAASEVKLEFQHAPVESAAREYVLAPRESYDGWFRRDAVHVVGGSSGTGKSTFTIDLLATQARRGVYLGHESFALPFLVIFADRPKGAVDETLERMGLLGQVPADYLKPCWGAVAAATILKKIEEHKLPPVVFIEGADLLVEDACKPKDVALFLSLLQEIALHYHLAFVLSVGAPKSKPDQQYTLKRDRIFGTQVWSRMAETVVLMTQTTDDYREVDVLHRNAASEHFDLMFANGRLALRTGQTEQEVTRENDPLWQWISAKRGQYFYRAEAVTAMKNADAGLSRASVYRRLSEWAGAGGPLEAIWDETLEKEYLRQRMAQ